MGGNLLEPCCSFVLGTALVFFVLDLLSDVTDVERKAAPLVFLIRM